MLHTTAIAIFFIEVLVAQARWEIINTARDDDQASQKQGSAAETEKEKKKKTIEIMKNEVHSLKFKK